MLFSNIDGVEEKVTYFSWWCFSHEYRSLKGVEKTVYFKHIMCHFKYLHYKCAHALVLPPQFLIQTRNGGAQSVVVSSSSQLLSYRVRRVSYVCLIADRCLKICLYFVLGFNPVSSYRRKVNIHMVYVYNISDWLTIYW